MRILFVVMLLCFALVGAVPPIARAQQSMDVQLEVFGLRFGDTLAQTKAKGLLASFAGREGSMEFHDVSRLPLQPSNTDLVSVGFVDRAGLQKIKWTSKNITDDIAGNRGKEAYAVLKATLVKKYGPPSRGMESTGAKLYTSYDEFYQCLDYAGCGMWGALWEGSFGSVILEIKSIGARGSGWLQVTYEGPRWAEAVERKDASTRERDAEAF